MISKKMPDNLVLVPCVDSVIKNYEQNLNVALSSLATHGWAAVVGAEWWKIEFSHPSQSGGRTEHEILEQNQRFGNHDIYQTKMHEMTGVINQNIRNYPLLHSTFENFLKAMCIQSWTALEVLFSDLLIDAMDNHSSIFNRDVKTKFPADFRRLETTKKHYSAAFQEPRINALFKINEVWALSRIRNVLVHCGGVADSEYLGDISDYELLKIFGASKLNDKINFNGDSVRLVLEPSIQMGYRLGEEVSNWIKKKSSYK